VSRETRTIRPFHTGSLDNVLDGVRLRFGEQECAPAASILVDDPETFARNRGEIIWAAADEFPDFKRSLREGVERLGVDPSALGLLVTSSTTFIRRTQILLRLPLDDLESLDRVTLLTGAVRGDSLGARDNPESVDRVAPLSPTERPTALRTGFHGAVVEAYVLLLRQLPRRPLQPRRKGTWLARANFRIDVDRGAELFRLTPLDSDKRTELGIPTKAVRYVDLEDQDLLEAFGHSPPPPFYVDEEFLAHLGARHSSPAGVALQGQLVHDFIAAVVWHSAANAAELELETRSWDDIEDSLLGRVLRFAAGPGASGEDKQMLLTTIQRRPEQILARAEHAIDMGKHLLAPLEAET